MLLRLNCPVNDDILPWIEIVFDQIHCHIAAWDIDLVGPLQKELDPEMTIVETEPAVLVVSVTDEVQTVNLYDLVPAVGFAICSYFVRHIRKFKPFLQKMNYICSSDRFGGGIGRHAGL